MRLWHLTPLGDKSSERWERTAGVRQPVTPVFAVLQFVPPGFHSLPVDSRLSGFCWHNGCSTSSAWKDCRTAMTNASRTEKGIARTKQHSNQPTPAALPRPDSPGTGQRKGLSTSRSTLGVGQQRHLRKRTRSPSNSSRCCWLKRLAFGRTHPSSWLWWSASTSGQNCSCTSPSGMAASTPAYVVSEETVSNWIRFGPPSGRRSCPEGFTSPHCGAVSRIAQ